MNLEIGYDLDTLLGSVALDYKLTLGDTATGDTPMYWGNVISGTAYYYYIDENAVKNVEECNFYFNSQIEQDYNVIEGTHVSYTGRRKEQLGTSPVVVNGSSTSVAVGGGGVWEYYNTLSPPYNGIETGCSIRIYNNDTGLGSSTPTYNVLASPTTNTVGTKATTNFSNISYTTVSSLHSANSNIPYLPVSGQNISYNDLRQYIVNEYNEQNPSETISINDLPAFDEDEIEPTYDIQPFSIDYNEILGEREMESIIAETRYILDTTPYEIESLDYQQAISEPYEEIKKIAVLDSDTKTAMSKIYDVAERMTRTDFLPLYAFSAIISIIMWFVFRR